MALFVLLNEVLPKTSKKRDFWGPREGGKDMKKNRYANNEAGVIKAPNKPSNSPKATVTKGSDLRNGTKKSK